MSFKHAKAVIVKATNGQVEMKDHSLIHLLNRYHCDINTKKLCNRLESALPKQIWLCFRNYRCRL